MIKISKFKIILLLSTFYFLFSIDALAAEVYFESENNEVGIGGTVSVNLMLDPQDEELNAIEGKIIFSGNLEPISIYEGSSMVSLWIQKPVLENNTLVFSGIMSGGYKGELSPYWQGYHPGKAMQIILKAKDSGPAEIKIKEAKVLLDDGKGTEADLEISNYEFLIFKEIKDTKYNIQNTKDVEPPEPFKPEIARDPDMFGGKYFLVFQAQDKGTGIYYYKVKEGNGEFETAESPYLLKNQGLYDEITVQAIDKAGNVREERLSGLNKKRIYVSFEFWLIAILLFLIIAYGYKKIRKT